MGNSRTYLDPHAGMWVVGVAPDAPPHRRRTCPGSVGPERTPSMIAALPFTRRAALTLAACMLCAAAHAQQPTLFLGDGPNKDTAKEVKNILLRPNAGTPFFAYVNNPSAEDRTVTAVLTAANGREIARTANIPAPANSKTAVTFKGDDKPLALTGTQVRLQLLDEKNKEINHSDLELSFNVPTRYAQATASFEGTRDTKNELRVTVTVAPVTGEPVKLKLDLSRVPGLVADSIKDGVMATEVPAAGGTAVLNARNLRFTGDPVKGWVAVSVDGYDRAFLFETAFDGSTPQRPPIDNVITIACPATSKPTDKFPVRIEVDQPNPADVFVEFGFDKSGSYDKDKPGSGVFESQVLPRDRKKAATIVLGGPEGALVFGSTVKDWVLDLDAAGVLGKRALRARLMAPKAADRPDTELRADLKQVTFDGSPPEAVKLDVPATQVRGTPLKVSATAVDVESGIAKVLFFIGDAPAPEVRAAVAGKVFLAAAPAAAGGAYTGSLPMSDTKGPVTVGVRVVNGVGLTTDATAEVNLIDPPAATAGNGKATTGKIKGVVVQGSEARPQPNRTVKLLDEKYTAILKSTEANAKGEFEFKDIAPGTYYVYSDKPSDMTKGRKSVTVEAGNTSEVTVALKRQGTK
jgi:hypothetical protein